MYVVPEHYVNMALYKCCILLLLLLLEWSLEVGLASRFSYRHTFLLISSHFDTAFFFRSIANYQRVI